MKLGFLTACLPDLPLTEIAEWALNGDPEVRARVNEHVRACVDAAALLGVPPSGPSSAVTSAGPYATTCARARRCYRRSPTTRPPAASASSWRTARWSAGTGRVYPANLAYSPELWEWMFNLGFWLKRDPSHLVGMGIDPVTALRKYVGHVAHVQAKDVEVLPGLIDRYGFFGKTREREDPWDASHSAPSNR